MNKIKAAISRVVEHWARVSPLAVGGLAPRHGLVQRYKPHELAQAIFTESDAAPVFIGKCTATPQDPNDGQTRYVCCNGLVPRWIGIKGTSPTRWARDGSAKCFACEGTGVKRAPVAVLLSNGAKGDAAARDALLAHADQLLADGNPLGELLSWTLLLWMREPADLTHADEAVRWLEWLTAQHELMQERVIQRAGGPTAAGTRSAYERAVLSLTPRVTSVDITTDRAAHAITLTYTGVATVAEVEEAIEPVRLATHWVTVVHANEGVDIYTVTIDGHEYSVPVRSSETAASVTAAEIVEALNAQNGPATFHVNANGSLGYSFRTVGSRSSSVLFPPAAVEFPASERRGHAEHIGSRLGRRLGVRR